jgi:hypothetical protein
MQCRRDSCRQFVSLRLPVPGQELIEVVDIVIIDAQQHVGKPSLGIDVVELGGMDQRQHDRGAPAATIGSGEQPRLPAEAIPRSSRSAALSARA